MKDMRKFLPIYLLLALNLVSCSIYQDRKDIVKKRDNFSESGFTSTNEILIEEKTAYTHDYYFPFVAMPPSLSLMPQSGTPIYLPNFVDVEAGCNWAGVAGQVFDIEENPIPGLVVEVGGRIDDEDVLFLVLSDTAQVVASGGFEIKLDNKLIEETHSLYIQVLNLDGEKLSRRVYFDMYGDCNKNLMLINFVEH